MKVLVIGVQWLIRVLAVVQVTLGVLFWTGNAFTLIQLHMLSGLVLLLSGDMHWLIKVLHLLVGIGAVGMAESLAVRTLRQRLRRDSTLTLTYAVLILAPRGSADHDGWLPPTGRRAALPRHARR
ncbi:MAG: hypothetical protein LC797_15510 [Chloroflexi bacterium]|nr:hypothetical protein [Chloroflexota bacterium]